MAFVRLAFFPGATVEHYEALARELRDAPEPEGRRAFVAGPVEGGLQVVQVWDARDQLDAFNEAWLVPALRRLDGGFPAPPVVTDLVAHDAVVDGTRI